MTFDEILLSRFVSNDTMRPTMMKVQHEDGKIIATNANVLLAAPNTYSNSEIVHEPSFPPYKKAIPKYPKDPIFCIDLFDLKQLLSKINKVPVYVDCESCEGCGSELCPACDHEHNCDNCRGTGKGRTIKEMAFAEYKDYILLGNVPFNTTFFESMYLVAESINCQSIKVHVNALNAANLFYLNDIMIIIMPIIGTEIENEGYTFHKVKTLPCTPTQ